MSGLLVGYWAFSCPRNVSKTSCSCALMGALEVAPWVLAFLLAFVLPFAVLGPVGPVRRPGEVSF